VIVGTGLALWSVSFRRLPPARPPRSPPSAPPLPGDRPA
jgi:hypothetical protein